MARRIVLSFLLMATATFVAMPSPAGADDATIVAYLTGAAERPGPGDPDAYGRADITITDATNQLCLTLQWTAVDGTLSGLHIHQAPSTDPGPVVVGFSTPPGGGSFSQCVTVANEALLDDIAANPQQYYINLHSTPLYPGGAIRGQLQLGPGDVTAPTCSYLILNSPRRITFTVQDTGSGLASITITRAENIAQPVPVPTVTPGTTASLSFTATKANQDLPARIAVVLTDVAGNQSSCI